MLWDVYAPDFNLVATAHETMPNGAIESNEPGNEVMMSRMHTEKLNQWLKKETRTTITGNQHAVEA